MTNQLKGKNKNSSVTLDNHSKTFLNLLKKDWKEKDENSFLYNHFLKSRGTDEKTRKSISEFFYNIKTGRSQPLTLSLLLEFCKYCGQSPNGILKFSNDSFLNLLTCDIKTLEKKVKLSEKDVLLPIQFDIHGSTVLYIRSRDNTLDYVAVSISPEEVFNATEGDDEYYQEIRIIPVIKRKYFDIKKYFDESRACYQADLAESDTQFNRLDPKKLDMFEPSLFYYDEASLALDSIDNKVEPQPKKTRKQIPFSRER